MYGLTVNRTMSLSGHPSIINKMPHFKAYGMRNLQYEVETCHKIHNKGTMSQ